MSNKTITTLSIIILFIFGVIGQTNLLQAEEYAPVLSIIAPYNSAIVLDGSFSEWNNVSQGYIDLFPMEPHDLTIRGLFMLLNSCFLVEKNKDKLLILSF
ncbi:MAG: hypothetical protein ACTSSG_12890 [Candidatus Heimdallarchaeaceae archaeon]